MEVFKSRLKSARKAAGFTQEAMASKFGMSTRAYQNWELGRNEPSLDNFAKLCSLLDVSADYLIGLDDEASADER